MAKNYLLDTNIFSNLIAGKLTPGDLPSDGQFWATPVQLQELKEAKADSNRDRLLSLFKELVGVDRTIPAAFAFDVPGAGWNQGEWRNDGSSWQTLKKDLDEAWEKKPGKKRKSSKKENNAKDASIAEAAKFNKFILLTCDSALANVAAKHGVEVQFLSC